MELIATLDEIEHGLLQWSVHTTPATDEDAAEMEKIGRLRDKLVQSINVIRLHQLGASTLNASNELSQLAKARDQLTAAARTIDAVESVIKVATTAASVAAKVAALVA